MTISDPLMARRQCINGMQFGVASMNTIETQQAGNDSKRGFVSVVARQITSDGPRIVVFEGRSPEISPPARKAIGSVQGFKRAEFDLQRGLLAAVPQAWPANKISARPLRNRGGSVVKELLEIGGVACVADHTSRFTVMRHLVHRKPSGAR